MSTTAHSAGFGHSRIISALGQPLRIDVPVKQLSADDVRTIQVSPAPAAAWAQAGLTPPVDLGTLQTRITDGLTPGSKVIQVRSTQAFDKPVADLLLDVRTASGQQRYQVSLLTHSSTMAKAGGVSRSIRVQQGDTMFDIAQRHAVPGVTVYQMMVALQRENPKAFIENNLNLVKAGAALTMPGMAQLTAISDREARRIFQKQAQAFALYRQRLAGQATVVGQEGSPAKGVVSAAGPLDDAQAEQGQRDQLRLSGNPGPSVAAGGASGGNTAQTNGQGVAAAGNGSATGQSRADVRADDRLATQKGIDDSEARVSQLERNVKDLNQALQAQGEAATGLLIDGARGLGITLPGLAGNTAGTAGNAVAAAGSPNATADSARTGIEPGSTKAKSGSEIGSGTGTGTNPGVAAGSSASGTGGANKVGDPASTGAGDGPSGTAASVNGVPADGQANAGNGATSNSSTGSSPSTGAASAPSENAASAPSENAASAPNTGAGPDQTTNAATGQSTGAGGGRGADAVSDQGAITGTGIGQSSNPGVRADAAGASTSPNGNAAASTGAAAVKAAPTASQPANSSNGTTAKPGANNTGNQSSPSGANGPDSVTEPISSKAEQTVSWIQEHMLGVITGLLALVVLIIAWILRRANAAHDDDHHGVVTEAMVKEKLDQINLDLEQSTPDDSTPPRR